MKGNAVPHIYMWFSKKKKNLLECWRNNYNNIKISTSSKAWVHWKTALDPCDLRLDMWAEWGWSWEFDFSPQQDHYALTLLLKISVIISSKTKFRRMISMVFFTHLIVPFAVRKTFFFQFDEVPVVGFNSWMNRVLSRKSFPTPLPCQTNVSAVF